MGRIFLDHIGGTCLFSCTTCDTILTNRSELISTSFTGTTGRAFHFTMMSPVIVYYSYYTWRKSRGSSGEVDMVHAVEDCRAGMAIRQAAKVHGVPRQTRADRLSGRVTHGCRSGPPTSLAPEDEKSVVQYCIYQKTKQTFSFWLDNFLFY
uniref:HTH psq-type domain-containing protein n=1 Tax=Oncorhynchus tshawytscha TaxID=74940 RepID=A0AAZ3P8X8_ONCTS